uniref:HTH CENPB-type domain-containing protein n=1 Tax=Chlorocebus sabaeus TaxID=60711 RepID=A0A0D9RBN5_CHLSB
KQKSLLFDMEKVLVVWIENQTSHTISLNQSLIQRKALLFKSMKANRGEKKEAGTGWFMRFKERSPLHNINVHGEAPSADVRAAASDPEDLVKAIDKGGYTTQQILSINQRAFYWKIMLSRTFLAREKSMPGFKASKDRLSLLLGANEIEASADYYKTPRALKNFTKSTLPVRYKCNNKDWMTVHLFTSWFTEYFKPTLEIYCSEKKISFKILLFIDNVPHHLRALMEMFKKINVVFMPANTTFTVQPMDKEVILTSHSYLRSYSCHSYSSEGCCPNQLKTFWKKFTILDAIKNICNSWEEVKISTLTGIYKKFIPTFMDDFESFKTPVKEITVDIVETAREVESEDVIELMQSHDNLLLSWMEMLLLNELRKSFLEMEPTADEDAVNIVEMTTKNLEYYINLIDRAVSGFGRIDSNFERSTSVDKMLSNSVLCYREIFCEKSSRCNKSYFKKLPQLPQPETTTTISQAITLRQYLPPAKTLCLAEGSC